MDGNEELKQIVKNHIEWLEGKTPANYNDRLRILNEYLLLNYLLEIAGGDEYVDRRLNALKKLRNGGAEVRPVIPLQEGWHEEMTLY